MPDQKPRSHGSKLALILLAAVMLGAGIYLRLLHLDKKVYWHDEVYTSLYMAGYKITEARRELVSRPEVSTQDVLKYQQLDPNKSIHDVVRSLASEDPVHTPLYFVFVRLWAWVFGGSIWSIRAFSVFASLLVFPCIYWLCRELFKSALTGWIAMMLVAVSPFHVFYAQEARQYSLLAAAILFASAALLYALRRQTRTSWLIYSGALVLGIGTHVLFGCVVLGHMLYMLGNNSQLIKWKRERLPPHVHYYLLATSISLVTFAPWAINIGKSLGLIHSTFGFIERNDSVLYLIESWVHSVGSLFVDIADWHVRALYGFDYRWIDLIHVPIAILAIYSIYFLWRHTEQQSRLFLLTLIGTAFLMLALPDLLLGKRASTIQRYLISSLVGMQVAVGYLFARQMTASDRARRIMWRGLFAVLIVAGAVSCAISSRAEVWPNKGNVLLPHVARTINSAPAPFVVCSFTDAASGDVVALSYLLEPRVRLRLMGRSDVFVVTESSSDLFLFGPAEWVQRAVKIEGNYRIEPVGESGLWRVVKN